MPSWHRSLNSCYTVFPLPYHHLALPCYMFNTIPIPNQVFYDATQFFSREGKDSPGLTDVIPAMDIIDEQLATGALDPALDPAIRVAVSLGKRSINHYYNKSDESAAYHTAMGAYHSPTMSVMI